MGKIIVDLEQPIVVHGGTIKRVVLREPGFREIMKFGEPFARGFASDGSVIYSAENIDAVRSYIEALTEEPDDPLLLGQISGPDALKIKDELIAFFQRARSKRSDATSTS